MEKPLTSTNGPIPQHNTFTFDETTFSSDFDSGNLFKVEKTSDSHFSLWVGPDCLNTCSEKSLRTWFYFSVQTSGLKKLTLKNLNLQGKLFRDGMKPVFKTATIPWTRIESSIICDVKGEVGSYFEVSFMFDFQESPVYFAFSYPWSYSDLRNSIEKIESKPRSDFYLHISNLIYTLEKRRCDLITISSFDLMEDSEQKSIQGLFLDENRPKSFGNKEVILISARVHPGETPSSHMVNGIVDFLISDDERAVALRSHFVFKVIPMLNPDGVFRGYFRTDTRGHDLNRYYLTPNISKQPTIYAVTELMKLYSKQLWAYIDLHAHVSKQGCFVYGNTLEFQEQIMNVLYAKIMASTCPWFSFENSCFIDEVTNKERYAKDGCGRMAAKKILNLVHSYTLEVNYHSSKTVQPVSENSETCNILDIQSFEKIGKIAVIALLYLGKKHPRPFIEFDVLKLETCKLLADQPEFRRNPEAKKASRSIENLNKYIESFKNNGGKFKYKIWNILNEKNKKKTDNNLTLGELPNIKNPQGNNDLKTTNGKYMLTKYVITSENSFQIRPRNSSFVKQRKEKKLKNVSIKMRDFNKCPDLFIL